MGSQEQTRGIEGAAAAEEWSSQFQALKDIVDTLMAMLGRDSSTAESSYLRKRAGRFTAA